MKTRTVYNDDGSREELDDVGHMPLPEKDRDLDPTGPEYQAQHDAWRSAYWSCGRCKTSKHTVVKNFSQMWGDGDLICENCNGYVRMIDTG